EQSATHVIPGGLELTLPRPPPAGTTERVKRGRTVSVVLVLAPMVSVAVIVVVPEFSAVARPVESIVATAVLLLVHEIPVPVIATGNEDAVVVPSPNWPHSFTPNDRTVPSP